MRCQGNVGKWNQGIRERHGFDCTTALVPEINTAVRFLSIPEKNTWAVFFYLGLGKTLANERRRYTCNVTCNVFVNWLRPVVYLWPGKIELWYPESFHNDVIKWKHFPHYWPFVRGTHRSPVNSPHKGQWRGALIFFICAWMNGWVNNREAGDLRPHRAHYDVTVM